MGVVLGVILVGVVGVVGFLKGTQMGRVIWFGLVGRKSHPKTILNPSLPRSSSSVPGDGGGMEDEEEEGRSNSSGGEEGVVMDDIGIDIDDDDDGVNSDDDGDEEVDARGLGELAREVNRAVLNMYGAHLSEDGRQVDYAGLAESPEFEAYRRLVAHLRRVAVDDLVDLERDDVMALLLNLYNALVIHANVEIGPPTNLEERVKFFALASYQIGPDTVLSLDEIEHGLLRGNARHPAPIFKSPLVDEGNEPVLAAVAERMRPIDPRIHFALVCGARSCPPIRLFSGRNLEFGLSAAASNFCGQSVRIIDPIHPPRRTLELSMIFKWYSGDFPGGGAIAWLAENAESVFVDAPDVLDLFTDSNFNADEIDIVYADYDWGLNDH